MLGKMKFGAWVSIWLQMNLDEVDQDGVACWTQTF